MGRGYTVDDTVEVYLSKLCDQPAATVTGVLVGQSSPQRDFVVMACRMPPRQEGLVGVGKSLDKEWISEHARQVSRMLPGGLSVLGVFIITDADAKETLTSLRQLVFTVQSLISSEHVWKPADDDVTDCLALHINPKSRKIICRTFDIKDPKSMAKPADWKYQSGVSSSWSMVTCCVSVDLLLPLPDCSESMDKCLEEALRVWATQMEKAVCLLDGTQLPEDAELTAGQKRNVRQVFTAQLLITPDQGRLTSVVQQCGGSLALRGVVHSRAYLHNNRPKAKMAEKLLKRDVLSTMVTRLHMWLEEQPGSKNLVKGVTRDQGTETFCLPHRVFSPVGVGGPLFVCDYQFKDDDPMEVIDRLKEMLDIDAADKDLDTQLEIAAEVVEVHQPAEAPVEHIAVQEPKRNHYLGIVMATAVALLAAAASTLYLGGA
ncbi:protein odr-4 homolog [Nerophis lumbriciformis]|uniref:protein odr-4 homolog n=1 Tax=Nerophis lumbriciformis TaxID=546530 RepID=UPI002AE0A2FD|nr:protein odr-4 homolog [Nerophis lumbriciformis]XP_061792551.1 protein odr-4 homolog [Nerophis lumbriciformis]